MEQYFVIKVEQCTTCDGGYLYDPHCSQCGQRLTLKEFKALIHDGQMPCGHHVRSLIEEYRCTECDGAGSIESRVSLMEALSEVGAFERIPL